MTRMLIRLAGRHRAARQPDPKATPPPAEPAVPATEPAPGPAEPAVDHLAAEARYHRERYDLYRAKIYSGRPTSQSRLRELQRSSESAEARLYSARRPEKS